MQKSGTPTPYQENRQQLKFKKKKNWKNVVKFKTINQKNPTSILNAKWKQESRKENIKRKHKIIIKAKTKESIKPENQKKKK